MAVKKIAVYILGDENKRGKLFVAVGSIIAGFLGLMFLPIAVISSIGSMNIEPPDIDKSLSYFDEVQNFNAESYAHLFVVAPNDSDLIAAINSTYGLDIDYDEFVRTYTFVMNSTINAFMFTDTGTKNCADLAAWADNAYISGWGYMNGFIGERNETDRIRYADNAGLVLGYLNYSPTDKKFDSAYSTLVYTEQGGIDTMPEVVGIGVFDGSQHGIYVGNGEVIYSSESLGYVTKENVSNGSWTSWCTYDGVTYPQEVTDAIQSVNEDSSSEN